ncbi:MAG TPA: methionine--tRNA ligase subunit beta [Candidatus Nanoarchaeia archaeon]|nr:methionine--tRNA ligase subunit beta [Candidatus Nanoarchaeia archaeon]
MEGIVSFSDWQKINLRVGKVTKAEDIEGADKLYKLEVDLGKTIGNRIICAGIKEFYSKEDLKGRKIVVVENLQPRKMRGIESQGMLLAAVSEDESSVVLVKPKNDVTEGEKIEFL